MKRYAQLFAFVWVFLGGFVAVSYARQPIYFGTPTITGANILAGFGYARCDFFPSIEMENLNKAGFYFSFSLYGTFLTVPLHQSGFDFSVSLAPGVGFAQKGTNDSINFLIGDITVETSYNSVSGHLYLRPKFSMPGNINIFSPFGVYAGSLFSPERVVSGSVGGIQYSGLEEIADDDFNSFDAGLVYGVGMRIVFFTIEARHYYGLTDIINYPDVITGEARWGRNRFTSLSLGFVF